MGCTCKDSTHPKIRELSAAVTSARMSASLKEELQMETDKEYLWTDSQIMSSYINNEA